MTQARTPGRRLRSRGARRDTTTVLAVALPVLCALALLLLRPGAEGEQPQAPTRTVLTSSTVVCPSASGSGVELTSAADGVHGKVTVREGQHRSSATVSAGRVTSASGGSGPLWITAKGSTAPGLVAARFGGDGLAALDCPAPAPQAWFTGVGGGADHSSVLELVNPDAGTAVADVTVYGRHGVLNAPRLRGVSVPGHSSVQLDLAQVVPTRDELALQVVAARGRVGATVLDRYTQIGARPIEDWMPAQPAPATTNLLMGVRPGAGARSLVIANPGDDEVLANIKLVTDASVFAPSGVQELRIRPQGVLDVSLSKLLGSSVADGVTGLQVTANKPVTATLRSVVGGDLADAVAGTPVHSAATVLAPEGAKTVVLAGAANQGVVTVVARSASGKEVAHTRAEVSPDSGATVKLPPSAVLVTVTPSRTPVTGAVLVTGAGGTAVIPLTEPAMTGLVPAVEPGLP